MKIIRRQRRLWRRRKCCELLWTVLFALGKLTFYGAVLCFLRSESLFSTLQYFIKNILIHCYSDYTTEWHTG